MAQTEQRAGFRLWGLARGAGEPGRPQDEPEETSEASAVAETAPETSAVAAEPPAETVAGTDAETPPETEPAAEGAVDVPPVAPAEPTAAPHLPTRFLAEMARAMQAAASDERGRVLETFRVDVKTYIEGIHGRAADEVGQLKKQADDDVAAVREWSKAEIARIREETERRIATRRGELDRHLEDHAALIESEIERVQAAVTAYERETESFFERLVAETDPAVIAELARLMPDPPSLEVADAAARTAALGELLRRPAEAVEPVADTEPATEAAAAEPESPPIGVPVDGGVETAPAAEVPGEEPLDPRLAALAMTPDLALAEREAVVDAANTAEVEAPAETVGEPIEEVSEESIAARLAGLVPSSGQPANGRSMRHGHEPPANAVTEQVVVLGLTSVASIASFKRYLGRLAGVAAVGVSSGPDGEFIFKVSHEPTVVLHDLVPTLPGFAARVTGSGEGILRVSARDPETDAS